MVRLPGIGPWAIGDHALPGVAKQSSTVTRSDAVHTRMLEVHELLRVCGGCVATVSFQGSSVVTLQWPQLVPGVITDNP